MWKYNIWRSHFVYYKALYVLLVGILISFNGLKAAYLTKSDLNKLKYSCYIESSIPVFCSFDEIEKPDLLIFLPLLKPVKLNNGVRAYRIMATITNKMPETITGAKVRLKFKDKESIFLDVMVTEPIKYNMSSSLNKSHLIREDVPKIRDLYEKIDDIYYSADTSKIEFEIRELRFLRSQ